MHGINGGIRRMDGWVDGRIDEWMNGWVDGRMGGLRDG